MVTESGVPQYSGVCTSQENPNTTRRHDWSGEAKAINYVPTTYASSLFSRREKATHYTEKDVYDKNGKSTKKKVADKWETVYNHPWTLAFHRFGFDIPDNAVVTKITFKARIKVENNNIDVLAPIADFRIATDNYRKQYDDTAKKGIWTGWNDGCYMVAPKSTKLSNKWQTYTYSISGDDLKLANYDNKHFSDDLMGVDLIWQTPTSIKENKKDNITKVGVYVEWVSCTIDYEVPEYKLSVKNAIKDAVDTTSGAIVVGDLISPTNASKIKSNSITTSTEVYTSITSNSNENEYIALNGYKGTKSEPYIVNNNNDFTLIFRLTNKSVAGGGGNRVIVFDIPFGTNVVGNPIVSSGTYDKNTNKWTIPHFNSTYQTCSITLRPRRNGLNVITASRSDDKVSYYYYVNRGSLQGGVNTINVFPNQNNLIDENGNYPKRHDACFGIDIHGQSNDDILRLMIMGDKDFTVRSDKDPFTLVNATNGVSIISQTDKTVTLGVTGGEDYDIQLNYCILPLEDGKLTLTVSNFDSTDYDTVSINVNGYADYHADLKGGDDVQIFNHRVYSELETNTNIINCIVDEIDSNMIMSDCNINMNVWEDLDYIGCIPLEHLHFDPKSTFKDTLIDTHYKNKRYMGKKLATDEDITLNVRLHPQQVTTLQGLIEMDKPIPINANHKCFEGDALNHRGWAEIYAVKTELTNPHWYKCDIDVKYLTHNLKTRFNIERATDSQDYEIPSILTEVFSSGDNLSDDSEDRYFDTTTDGTFMYIEDYEDPDTHILTPVDDAQRNLFSIDNGENIRIRTHNPVSHTSQFSFTWESTLLAEYRENAISRIIRLVDKTGNSLVEYVYDDVRVDDEEVTANLSYSTIDGRNGHQNSVTLRYNPYIDVGENTDDEIEEVINAGNTTYGSTVHFNIKNNTLQIIEDGFSGREVEFNNIPLTDTEYYYEVEWVNNNDDGESDSVESFFDFQVQETVLTTTYSDKFGKMIVSPFPVIDRNLLFTREADEGTIYYYEFEEGKEFSYIVEPYYQYHNGCDLVTKDNVSIFNLNYGYDIVYIQNGLVRLGFNRLDKNGHMYLGKYDPQSQSYITTNILHLGKFLDLNLNSIDDDKIEVQASDSTFTIYRGHPYIKINHKDEDIFIDTIFNKVWAEKVGNDVGEELPLYWNLCNDKNLLPESVGGVRLDPSQITIDEEPVNRTDTSLSWYTTPSNPKTDVDLTFSLSGGTITDYGDEVDFDEYECIFGEYSFEVESDGVPRTISLIGDKDTIQKTETTNLLSKVTDGTNPVANQLVSFYKQTSTIEDDLTTDTGLFELSNSNATVTYGGDGMTFRQTTSNESTILKSTFGLDLANYSYDMEFKLVNYTTGDNAPLRFRLYDEDGVSSSWAMLVNRTVGYLFCGTSWTRNTNHNISNGTVFKIHFEDGNHKLYKNGELVASSSMVYGKIMYIGWLQWQGYYFTITDFKMEEI